MSRSKISRNLNLPKHILHFLIILFLFILIALPLFHLYLKGRINKQITIDTSKGIDTLIAMQLDEQKHWIKLRGWNRNNPIILFVHGGPGAPLFPHIKDLGYNTDLEKNYVIAYWEQIGTGKSFQNKIPDSIMTIDKFVTYTIKLSQYIKNKFSNPKLYIIARSWGSLISLFAVNKNPELFNGYISIGQLIYPLKNDSLSYEHTIKLAQRFNNNETLKKLEKVGYPPYNSEQIIKQRRWLTKFYHQFMEQKFGVKRQNLFVKLLSTPEYSIFDIIRMGKAPFFSIQHLWDEDFYQINLFNQIETINIPITFIIGKYDFFTSPELTKKFYKELNIPAGKELIEFKESGHHPELEQPQKFKRIINRKLDSLTQLE